MFEAYITNTALYPLMGIEVGTTVHFPMTTQELQAALAKIGIDGKRYSEVFFTSFDSDVLGPVSYTHLGGYYEGGRRENPAGSCNYLRFPLSEPFSDRQPLRPCRGKIKPVLSGVSYHTGNEGCY